MKKMIAVAMILFLLFSSVCAEKSIEDYRRKADVAPGVARTYDLVHERIADYREYYNIPLRDDTLIIDKGDDEWSYMWDDLIIVTAPEENGNVKLILYTYADDKNNITTDGIAGAVSLIAALEYDGPATDGERKKTIENAAMALQAGVVFSYMNVKEGKETTLMAMSDVNYYWYLAYDGALLITAHFE